MDTYRRAALTFVMLFRFAFAISLATKSVIAAPLTTTIDFDTPATTPKMVALHGNKIEGSQAAVTTDSFHSAPASLKMEVKFGGVATFEEMPAFAPVIATGDGTLKFTIWVKGAGGPAMQTGALRLIDSKGELFQYQIKGLPEALDGNEWTNVTADLDLMKYSSTWGPNTDGRVKYPLKFFAIVGDHVKQALSEATIYLDDISFVSEVIPRPMLERVEADRDLLLAKTGEAVTLTPAVRDAATAQGALAIAWRVKDIDGNVVDQTTLPATGIAANYTFTAREPGWAGVECQLQDERGPLGPPVNTAVAVIDKPGVVHNATDPYIFGVCAHLLNYPTAQTEKDIALMQAVGFGACRLDFVWHTLQPAEDRQNWARTDDLVTKLLAVGVMPCPNMGYSANWASSNRAAAKSFQEWAFAPPLPEKYTAFMKAAVERYKVRVHHWEVWNEPDLGFWRGTAPQYGELLGAAVQAAHQADPTATVMNGGISERYEFKTDFTPQFLACSNPKPDIFAYHSHGPVENLYVASAKVRTMLKAAGMENTPVWLNEAGLSSCRGWGTEKDKALQLVKKMATSQALGDRAFMLYDMRNDGENATDPEANYGIVRKDFTPLPAYVAVHTLISSLSGKTYTGALQLGPGATAYSYGSGGDTVVVAWTSSRSATVSGLLRTNAASAILCDMMGRRRKVPVSGGAVPLPVGYDPVLLTLPGQKGPLAALDSPLECASVAGYPGNSGTLVVTVKNPLTKKLQGEFAVKATGVAATLTPVVVSLEPGASQTIKVDFTVPAGAGGNRSLRLQFVSSELPPVTREVPCIPALVLPWVASSATEWQAAPTVALKVPQNSVSLFGATYEEGLKLRPGNDLGATVWLRATPAGLQLRVDVTDDVHFQEGTTADLWKADSVQLAISTNNGHIYEWTAALTAAGPVLVRTQWPAVPVPATPEAVKLSRTGTITRYDIVIPASLEDIALSIREGCSISLLVNDNDGKGRKGWVEWTPGIGVLKDPTQYKRVLFQAAP